MRAMRFRWALLQLSVGLALGCENPQPTLTAVEPAQAYSDSDLRLSLVGRDFVPATILDPLSGRRIATSDGFSARIGKGGAWAKLDGLDWLSTGVLAASFSGDAARWLPAGSLDLEVTDPRGYVATLTGAFMELGADGTAPSITFTSPAPDALFAAGMGLRGGFLASDSPPGTIAELGWTSYENGLARATARCLLTPGQGHADCGFQVTLSPTLGEGDVVRIVADATDASANRNRAEASLSIILRGRPSVLSIFPDRGGTAGGTDVVITGTGFLPGSQAALDGELLFPDGGIVVDESTISGHVPAHAAGSATLAVGTPLGNAGGSTLYTYLPPPRIASITPGSSAAAGTTAVAITGDNFSASTHIYFGTTLTGALPLQELFLQSETSIIGRAPPGSGQTTVWAFDEALGFSKLPGGFTWRTP